MEELERKGDVMIISNLFSKLRHLLVDLQRELPDADYPFLDVEGELEQFENEFDSWAMDEELL